LVAGGEGRAASEGVDGHAAGAVFGGQLRVLLCGSFCGGVLRAEGASACAIQEPMLMIAPMTVTGHGTRDLRDQDAGARMSIASMASRSRSEVAWSP
jgi:hypothetical protein